MYIKDQIEVPEKNQNARFTF